MTLNMKQDATIKTTPNPSNEMTDKEKLSAKMKLTCSYLERFGEPPDKATEILINASLARVHSGELFEWDEHGENWRILRWNKK